MSLDATPAEFPLEALARETEALLVANGVAVPHGFGEKHLAANVSAPRYAWIPGRTVVRKETATRTAVDFKTIYNTVEQLEIHCWGRTFAQAWAMRCNALVAMRRLAQADLAIESGDWIRPGQGWNQSGQVYVLVVSLLVPTIDAYSATIASPSTPDASDELPVFEASPTVAIASHSSGVELGADYDGPPGLVIEEP
jgi:hypothetical protein